MSSYNPDQDGLYAEALLGRDIMELVDLIQHSAFVLKHAERRPYKLHGKDIPFTRPVSDFNFFVNEWQGSTETPCRIRTDELGLAISPVHISAILFGMRQNYFDRIESGKRVVGWYLDPEVVYRECLPGIFEKFEAAYARDGALGLQSRGNDFLAKVAIGVGQYMDEKWTQQTSKKPFKHVEVV